MADERQGNCNAFDDGASGYCRADGVGAVILKRLEDAIADNDPIFGVITGTNTNHCGQTDSITRPHEGDQVSVFRRVLRYHNVNPDEVGYIEMHGTGTQAGDATEMRSVLSVFLPQQKRRAEQPLYLGSVKANIGHAESASGVLSLIKVLLMMKHDKIPPHCGIKTQVNRHYPVDLAERNVRIALQSTPWRRQEATGGTRRVFLNNFSAAGGNTAILLEDAPVLDDSAHQASAVDSRGMHLVAVTAKTPTSLSANTQTLLQFLESNPSTSLPALAYTTTARRLHHRYRVTCIGDSIPSIVTQLRRLSSQPEKDLKPVPAATPKVTFVFTGQGSVYPGLGRQLFESVPSFREDILSYNRIAQKHGFPPFISLIDGSSQNVEEVDPCISQLALVCLQMALSQLWTSWGVCPSLVIGHSLGEYAALFTAGVITASDAIFLAGCRAKLLSQSCTPGTHAMLALKKPATAVQTLLQGSPCEIACINQPMGTVVSGPKESILQLESKVRQEGSEPVLLDIPFAFHSAQVDPILEDFQAAARTVQYRTPQVPVLSPLLGRVVREEHLVDDTYLVKACRAAVNFQGAIKAAQTDGLVDRTTVWLEIGSHPACSGMIKGTLGSDALTIASLRKSNNAWKCIVSALDGLYLAGVGVNWNGCHRGFPASHQVIQLPRYNWDTKNYWIMYRNDFCLTKGTASHPLEDQKANPVAHRYISPSVQRVLEETHGLPVSTLLVESDICHPRLLPALTGHIVNGAALGPSVCSLLSRADVFSKF
jgi:naphtho-gamma-pyrone polyketide synthase